MKKNIMYAVVLFLFGSSAYADLSCNARSGNSIEVIQSVAPTLDECPLAILANAKAVLSSNPDLIVKGKFDGGENMALQLIFTKKYGPNSTECKYSNILNMTLYCSMEK